MNKSKARGSETREQELPGSTGSDHELPEIPDKLYFKIGEVSNITGVETHVLRYWESEIKVIKPQRAASKQRLYRRPDIENILIIKRLIHQDGYTLTGVRKFFAAQKKKGKGEKVKPAKQAKPHTTKARKFCKEMKSSLEEIKKMLETKRII